MINVLVTLYHYFSYIISFYCIILLYRYNC